MANTLYSKGKEGILDGSIDVVNNDIYAALCSAAYTPNLLTDEDLGDVTGIVATVGPLTSKTVAGGVFDAADITALSVSGSQITQVVIYQSSGSPVVTRLIGYYDTGTGLPITPSGANIPIQWDNGASKIFAL